MKILGSYMLPIVQTGWKTVASSQGDRHSLKTETHRGIDAPVLTKICMIKVNGAQQ